MLKELKNAACKYVMYQTHLSKFKNIQNSVPTIAQPL
jgi:hypothetical protein